MSATDDLREKLEHAFASSWSDEGEYSGAIDALIPTVREALAEAWDEGYAGGRQDVQGSVYAGRKITRDNPWREGA